jgi:DNA-directed RNA polymerase subunit RPC12/RpoP
MLWACQILASDETFPVLDGDGGMNNSRIKSKGSSQEEASYICDACGEEIVIPLDLSEGTIQSYVEDCPVCNRLRISTRSLL